MERFRKGIILIIFILTFLGHSVNAGINSTPFLNRLGDAYTIAIGNGVTVKGLSAQFDNPAGIVFINDKQVKLVYDYMTYDRKIQFMSMGLPMGRGAAAFSIINSGVGDVELYSSDNLKTGTGSEGNWAMYTTFAFESDILKYGVGVGFIYKTLLTEKGYGYYINVGIQSNPIENLLIGFSARNVINSVMWKNNKDEIERNFNIGVSYNIQKYNISFMGYLKKRFYRKTIVLGGGAEYRILNNCKIRVGYSKDFFNIGLNFRIRKLEIGYVYHTDPIDIIGNHLIELTMHFGPAQAKSSVKKASKKPAKKTSKPKITKEKSRTEDFAEHKLAKKENIEEKTKIKSVSNQPKAEEKKAGTTKPEVKEEKEQAKAEKEGEMLSVKYNNVKLKAEPDFKSDNIHTFSKGDMVEVLERKGKWVKVKDVMNDVEGWAYEVFFEKIE